MGALVDHITDAECRAALMEEVNKLGKEKALIEEELERVGNRIQAKLKKLGISEEDILRDFIKWKKERHKKKLEE